MLPDGPLEDCAFFAPLILSRAAVYASDNPLQLHIHEQAQLHITETAHIQAA